MRKSFVYVSSLALLLVMMPLMSAAAQPRSTPQVQESLSVRKSEEPSKTDANGRAVYIVRLKDAPLASYTGGVAGIPATSPKANGATKLDSESAASRSYARYLADQRSKVISALQRTIGRNVRVTRTYDTAYNGFAVALTSAEADTLKRVAGVVHVQRDTLRQPLTDVGPVFIGAQQGDAARTSALFKATLTGAQEVPPVTSSATGAAMFDYNPTTKVLSFKITLQRITPTLGHIHRGAAGVAGPVAYDLMPYMASPNTLIGSVTISPADETLLNTGGLYVNFHTTANPGGEIRGQILQDKGEGMLVGIFDTGINATHPSFAAVGPLDGYVHTNPYGSGNYKGVCNPANTAIYQPAFQCNDKLVGAWSYTDENDNSPLDEPSPADDDGHGSHTASTTAGNVVNATVTITTGQVLNVGVISGVAPHANIISYDVCDVAGCYTSGTVAAVDQAVKDRVDVINYSIGGGSDDPWDDDSALAFLNALDAGVFASVSAGNSGPGASTIGSPSNAPWVMSVAASTHTRRFTSALINLSGGSSAPPTDLVGTAFSSPMAAPAPIVYAGNYNDVDGKPNPACTKDFPAGTFSGQIVVCDWGSSGRVARADRVKAAGGGGFVLANTEPDGVVTLGDIYPLPAVQLGYNKAVQLKAWLASGTGQTAQITGTNPTPEINAANGDLMAAFSSRGPEETVPDVLKPDVSAPGVNIVAALNNTDAAADEYGVENGTSMAAPHNAGAAALVRSLHPDWSVAEVQSALMTTAVHTVRKEDGTTPADAFDVGSGRIDVGRAAQAGLVLNETAANFDNADPFFDGDPRTLNRASMADSKCIVTCSWTRTLRNTLGVATTWSVAATGDVSTTITVTPATFTVQPGSTQTITVTADVSKVSLRSYGFGAVTLTPTQVGTLTTGISVPSATLPVAAQSVASNLKSTQYIETDSAKSTDIISDVLAIPISNLTVQTHGLVRGSQTTFALSQDSDNTSPTDVLTDGVYLQQRVVPANTSRLVSEVVDSGTASDLDMYVYLDGSNGQPKDGKPQDAELACISASGTALEYCNIDDPEPGTYIILVQDWEGAQAPAQDTIKLSTAVVPTASSNNFTVTGPTTQAGKTPFNLAVNWDLQFLDRTDRWYGAYEVGTDAANAGNLGRTNVDLVSTSTGSVLYLPLAGRP